jgi:hypothetical protein
LISQQEGKVGIPLIDLTPPHCYACHKRGPVFRTSNAVVYLFVLTELRWEVIVHFVEIGGIVDHQSCLNVFFIIMIKALFLYFNLCLRLKLDSLMSIYIHIIYD